MMYDAEKHIDINRIKEILKENEDKKIYVFGGGTAAEILMETVLNEYKVEGFLDNNSKIWGNIIFGKEIMNPDILKSSDIGKYIVLILSKHVNDISIQLEEMGLKKNLDYYDIYNEFKEYFRVKKFENSAKKFRKFVENIPEGSCDNQKTHKNKKIGVIVIGELAKESVWYQMLSAILFAYKGYEVEIVVDCLKSYDDYVFFDGVHNMTKVYIEDVLNILVKKFPEIKINYIDEYGESELDEDDNEMIRYHGIQSVKWLDSRKDDVFLENNEKRIEISQQILRNNMKVIKAFFEKKAYDTVLVYTGIHRHRCIYNYVCQKKQMKVYTYDGATEKSTLCSNNVAGHSENIKRVLEERWFKDDEVKKVIELAKENFRIRRYAVNNLDVYSYQIAQDKEEIEKGYDIIIPLNISWDAAALARDRVFSSQLEWLQETIDYVMENTTATLMIREHPAQNFFKEMKFVDIQKSLQIEKYKDRVRFYKAEEKINTYQYIEKAKLVLPYTSTTGLEAVILDKPIIVHTKCYYENMPFANRVGSKKEYFDKIKELLESENVIPEDVKDWAYIAYICQINNIVKTKINLSTTEWMEMRLEEVIKDNGISKIINIVAEDIPSPYLNIKELIG